MPTHTLSGIVSDLDPPLVVVTTAVDDERAGCLVGFHAQSSIDPERYCVWLSKANHTYRVALRSTHLAVHFLTSTDLPLAQRFGTLSGDDTDKFFDLTMRTADGGVPVLAQCTHWIVGQRIALLDEGGDHVCTVLQTTSAENGGAFQPLRLSQVSDLQPGHESTERHGPPTERAAQ